MVIILLLLPLSCLCKPITVETSRGTVQGFDHDFGTRINQTQRFFGYGQIFLGIPYAKAPFGERRFTLPEDIGQYNGKGEVHNATYFRPRCWQRHSKLQPAGAMSEDCLYLNVMTPNTVMEWVVETFEAKTADHEFYLKQQRIRVERETKNYVLGKILPVLKAEFGFEMPALIQIKEECDQDPEVITIDDDDATSTTAPESPVDKELDMYEAILRGDSHEDEASISPETRAFLAKYKDPAAIFRRDKADASTSRTTTAAAEVTPSVKKDVVKSAAPTAAAAPDTATVAAKPAAQKVAASAVAAATPAVKEPVVQPKTSTKHAATAAAAAKTPNAADTAKPAQEPVGATRAASTTVPKPVVKSTTAAASSTSTAAAAAAATQKPVVKPAISAVSAASAAALQQHVAKPKTALVAAALSAKLAPSTAQQPVEASKTPQDPQPAAPAAVQQPMPTAARRSPRSSGAQPKEVKKEPQEEATERLLKKPDEKPSAPLKRTRTETSDDASTAKKINAVNSKMDKYMRGNNQDAKKTQKIKKEIADNQPVV